VVHGDVTPANVLFTDIGLPLLADLGVARLLGDGDFGDAEVVRTTPSYAAPGVAAGGIPTTGSDVFMLGATALHALTGRPPWPGDASNALAAARSGRLPELSELFETAGVPDPVAAVVARALELDAARRATAAEFALELRHAARPVAVELHAGRGPVSDPGRRPDIPPGSVPLRTAPPRAAVPPPGLPPGRAPLTDGVRAPSPFAAQPGRHAVRERRTRRTLLRVAVIAAVVIGVLGFWAWQHKEAPVPAPRAADGLATSASSNVAGPSDPPSQPVTQSPTPAASGTATSAGRRSATPPAGDPVRRRQSPTSPYLSALQRLDALRARAYASRAPDLLARVYASRALRARDMAAMRAAVPPGCGLRGLHTRFEAVRALAVDRTSVVVRTRAVVSPAVLRCGQSGFRALRAPPPVRLTIRLARGDGGLMIAGLTR
jgi:serine/threonine protein kinase